MTMHHKFRYSMQIVFTCVVTIASWGCVEGAESKVISGGTPTVGWGTVTEENGSIVHNTSFTDVFPSVSQFSSKFLDGPILKLTASMAAEVAYTDEGSTNNETRDVAHGIYLEGGYFSKAPIAKIIAFGHEDRVCAGDETVTVTRDGASLPAADGMLMTFVCDTGADNTLAVAATTNFIFLIGNSDGFYPQCDMTLKSGVIYDTTADVTSVIVKDDLTSAAAATMQCGCTVKSGITHTDGELKLDVVLTSPVAVPHTVFQLARDASEKLLLDTEATAAADYLTTWTAGKVTAKFTTGNAGADTVVPSDSVTAKLPTADEATDLHATLVSLPTNGAEDDLVVAIDGTTNDPVKFEFTFNKDLCLGNEKVYVNCFLYRAAADNAAVDATVAANYVGKEDPQEFDCETGSDDSGAENSIGFSMFLLMLTALAIEL